jgi:MoaA/NifB/PqqE/SkfB family radical SAM enzyme
MKSQGSREMLITGVHLLQTYQCNLECDHCFVWGSPWQTGTMSLDQIRDLMQQAKDLGSVKWFYFEGGEPFLYYQIMRLCIEEASAQGFSVGIVSNGYWATEVKDAIEWLKPLAGLVQDLSISSDRFHWGAEVAKRVENMKAAAAEVDIPVGFISIAQPEASEVDAATGKLPLGESGVMFRGRAVEKLVSKTNLHPWREFNECPYENLREPGRVHVDPFGNVHICQGISLGNVFQTSLKAISLDYDPEEHPVTGPLLRGGPVALIEKYKLPHKENYADACHLCDHARRELRAKFPDILMPDQMYAVA